MKLSYVQLGGEKHPVCFSLSAIEAIEEEFGSLDNMREGLVGGKVKAINRVLEIMIDAGRAYCAAMDLKCPPKLKCRPGDLIDITDGDIVKDILGAMAADGERKIETKGKN